MKLDIYIRQYEQAVERLPELLARWDSLAEEVRDHYVDTIAWKLADQVEALAVAKKQGRLAEIAARISELQTKLAALAFQHTKELGLGPDDFNFVATSRGRQAPRKLKARKSGRRVVQPLCVTMAA